MDDYITTERIEALCDIILLRSTKHIHQGLHQPPLAQIPRLYFESEESIQKGLEFIGKCKRNPLVFCYVDFYDDLEKLLPRLPKPIVLVSNGGDIAIEQKHLRILESDSILHWFGTNPRIQHPKLTAVPIGMANSMWAHGNLSLLQKVQNDLQEGRIQKRSPQDLFVCFRIETNRKVREPILQSLLEQGFQSTNTSLDYESYLRTLASYCYAACPPGNGIDCHRMWECFALQVVPLVEKDRLWDSFPGLPIVQLDSWKRISLPTKPFELQSPFSQLSYWSCILSAYQSAQQSAQ